MQETFKTVMLIFFPLHLLSVNRSAMTVSGYFYVASAHFQELSERDN